LRGRALSALVLPGPRDPDQVALGIGEVPDDDDTVRIARRTEHPDSAQFLRSGQCRPDIVDADVDECVGRETRSAADAARDARRRSRNGRRGWACPLLGEWRI